MTLVDVDPSGPRKVRFTYESSLGDPRLLVVQWRGGKFEPIRLPEVGGSMRLVSEPGALPY